ncbi:serine/threonine protein kinase [Labilithrix luteola]|nr:serine/threonine-protein kinase [Labilithrix luteola]
MSVPVPDPLGNVGARAPERASSASGPSHPGHSGDPGHLSSGASGLRGRDEQGGQDGLAGDTELPPPLEAVDGAPTEIHSSAAFEAVLRAGRFGPEPGSGVSSVPAAVVAPTEPPEHTHIAAPPDLALMAASRVAPPPPRAPKSAPTLPKAAPPPMRPRVATIVHAGAPPLVGAAARSSKAHPSSADLTAAAAAALGVPLSRHCTTCDARYPADFLICPRDATPLVEETSAGPADPLVGMLVGDTYQMVRLVGEGGMGRVYEARHLRLKERRFAIKTLHADLARNPEIVARFMREAESASSLAHENVIDVFDVHHLPDGTPYLVGEFLEGEELAVYVSRYGALSAQMAIAVGRQVARALAAAHARGIIHRDMKPENIFVLQSSIDAVTAGEASGLSIKVLDFGISKATGADRTDLTRTGVIMGTPSYMSPEQASGKEVDLRADIYSLGAVLYFALTGKRPFDAPDPTSTLSMVLTQVPPRLRSVDAQIPRRSSWSCSARWRRIRATGSRR